MAIPQLLIDATLIPFTSEIEIDWPEAFGQTTGDGGEVTSARTKGATIRATIQVGRMDGLYGILHTLHGGVVGHAITINDPDLGVWDFDVNWKARPPLKLGLPGIFNAITLTFTERP